MGGAARAVKGAVKGLFGGNDNRPVIVEPTAPVSQPPAPAAAPVTAPVAGYEAETQAEAQAKANRRGKKGVTINRIQGGGSGLNV